MPSSGLKSTHPNADTICDAAADREAYDQVEPALKLQNIDWNTWLPEPPLKVAGHEAVFNPDGSVKVGCQVITSKDVDEILKRREKAMVKEWPKYYMPTGIGGIYRARHADDLGQHRSLYGEWCDCGGLTMEAACSAGWVKRITASEAAARICISEADL